MLALPPTTIQPGFYSDVPFEDYLKWPFLSQSAIKQGSKSMGHLRAYMDEELRTPPTDDMLLGSALHCAFLEPELMPEKVVLWEQRRAGKEWEAFKAHHAGKVILTATMHEKLVGMTKALRAKIRAIPELSKWHQQTEAVEVSVVGEVHGVMLKGRIDALTPAPLIDLKKVTTADKRLFQSKSYELGYHIQAFIYCQLCKRDRFIYLAVESEGPYHDVVPFEVDKAMMRRGGEEACRILEQVAECEKSGRWPGRADDIVTMSLPKFATADDACPPAPWN